MFVRESVIRKPVPVTHAAATIAVVDDDHMVRDSLKVLLETRDFEVVDFASGSEFLDKRVDAHPRCVILDIHMPQMTGLELLKTMRSRGDKTPVILITGRPDAAMRAQAEALGAVALLEKPVSFAALFGALNTATSSSRPH
jgi:two-component system, LuxR family, response regulator FixJ